MHVWVGLLGPLGLHMSTRELQTCTVDGNGASNTTKIQRKDQQEREKRVNTVVGEGKQRAKFWGVQRRGPVEGVHRKGSNGGGGPAEGLGLSFQGKGFWGQKQKQNKKKIKSKIRKKKKKREREKRKRKRRKQEKTEKEEKEETPSVRLRPIATLANFDFGQFDSEVELARGAALESAGARVCREAGARVSTNVFVRDLDIATFNTIDSRRLEVVADGLPLFGGAQLAIDTMLVRHPETELLSL